MTITCPKGLLSTRFVIAIMLFTSCFTTYMMRVNISINLIAMVEPSNANSSDSEPECARINRENSGNRTYQALTAPPDYGTRYDWDSNVQSLILGSYFWGYTITCIPGGVLGEKFGPTRTVMIATLASGFLTLLGPLMASWSYIALILSRFLTGLCGGVVYPCLHCLVSRWAPPEEKGKFIGALLGGTFGTVATWPLLGAIIEGLGWSWSFFINGGLVLLWCILWIILVADRPEVHPRISEDEKIYIMKSLGDSVKPTKGLPPYKNIFLSIPFWALIVLHFGNLWGLYFLMTAGPKFLSSVLGFNLGHTGILAALPYLARLIFGFIFGFIGDFIRQRKVLSTTVVRKGFILFSHIIPGALLLVLNLTGCDVTWSIVLLTLSLGSNGASTLTNLQNSQDLAPNYAGSLYGIANCIGSTTGFISPIIVGQITAQNNGMNEWHVIFCIGALVYIICGLVFCIFGRAEIQAWNAPKESQKVGIQNPAFDNTSEITVKVGDADENTKV
ncbi:sialin-like [Tribolium madens]|uniref:sialin-like n=1 Tax=Tribolium madens TaxID=41895 RepID=UPI001CF75B79|nr:sialin-like [Tribolium madens]XP_044253591.1 sialin-like [Tribolium madens]